MAALTVTKVITGLTNNGQSVLTEQGPVEPVTLLARAGSEFFQIWGTDGTAAVGAAVDEAPSFSPFFPAVSGTRFIVLRFAPDGHGPSPGLDFEELAADAERKLPGLMSVLEPGSRMHTTDTIDYGMCVDGEIWLELDDGAEVRLTPGTCVVQRGTRHAWHNRSDRPCTMVFVVIGAERQ